MAKEQLYKIRITHSETAMTNVLREILIMKQLDNPNIVKFQSSKEGVGSNPTSDTYLLRIPKRVNPMVFDEGIQYPSV